MDDSERGADLGQKLVANVRFLQGKRVLDAAKDTDIDGRLSSENLMELIFLDNTSLLPLILLNSLVELSTIEKEISSFVQKNRISTRVKIA